MAETSNIAWTRSTFNPWIGCTRIGPGCDGCYAEVLDKRHKFGGATHWGAGVPRFRTSKGNWNKPLKWNQQAKIQRERGELWAGRPGYWPVFCASLADVFDNEVPDEWRRDLIDLIELTPNLQWLLVTKRIGNVADMLRRVRTHDWLASRKNVRILITVVNQEEADRDIPKLLALPCKNGISYEPALGPVDWSRYLRRSEPIHDHGAYSIPETNRLQWIIVGGESSQGGHAARPFNIEWARSTIAQCKSAGVPVFMKQIGSKPNWCAGQLLSDEPEEPNFCDYYEAHEQSRSCDRCAYLKDRAGADPDEWPVDLRVREFPI